jgi:hypothetical protein
LEEKDQVQKTVEIFKNKEHNDIQVNLVDTPVKQAKPAIALDEFRSPTSKHVINPLSQRTGSFRIKALLQSPTPRT